ncbi:UDP-N-acetylglucosamine 2-epimerase, partial [uncultured Helicobacter sp.]|uniref:UDP-N-acetylglucosamine 2-epimerase n=1 Tax=uncultured Helicobacter sp. TaxID=175537 RepID=UPI0026288593
QDNDQGHRRDTVENIHNTPFMSKTNLAQKIQVKKAFLDRFCVLTFHSTTLDNTNPSKEITLILQSLLQSNFNILATKANADAEGHSINLILEEYAKKYPDKITLCASLGRVMYLSSLKFAAFVIGNSSSGLSEAPILGIPTINIGDRQKGRFMPQSVVSITPNQQEPQQYTQTILNTITYVTNNAFLSQMTHSHPFGEGKTAEHITDIIESILKNNTINLKKAFYMLENPNF